MHLIQTHFKNLNALISNAFGTIVILNTVISNVLKCANQNEIIKFHFGPKFKMI